MDYKMNYQKCKEIYDKKMQELIDTDGNLKENEDESKVRKRNVLKDKVLEYGQRLEKFENKKTNIKEKLENAKIKILKGIINGIESFKDYQKQQNINEKIILGILKGKDSEEIADDVQKSKNEETRLINIKGDQSIKYASSGLEMWIDFQIVKAKSVVQKHEEEKINNYKSEYNKTHKAQNSKDKSFICKTTSDSIDKSKTIEQNQPQRGIHALHKEQDLKQNCR